MELLDFDNSLLQLHVEFNNASQVIQDNWGALLEFLV